MRFYLVFAHSKPGCDESYTEIELKAKAGKTIVSVFLIKVTSKGDPAGDGADVSRVLKVED